MTVRYAQEIPEVSADRGDADVTLAVTEVPIQLFATTLTANRTITLPIADNYNGAWFKIVRTGLGAFTLDVGGLYTIPASEAAWVDVRHNGTSWQVHSVGRVSDVGALSAHEHDHVANLETDSRLHNDPISDYPTGYSSMPSADYDLVGTFAGVWNSGVIETARYTDEVQEIEMGFQVHKSPYPGSGAMIAYRTWDDVSTEWGAWETVNKWNDITGKPSVFAPSSHAASHKGDGSDPIDNATTSVAGLESAADKTKLDGIETAATADMTAAEILTAVKAVDGAGSGLDADLLDGTSSAGFATASHSHLIADLPVADDNESNANEVVRSNDSRLSNARTPTSHATSHVTGGSDVIANAVASGNAGLLSGSDKAKIDGVETGATADQTASEILTAIKTVDGSGSGLDADTLDGADSTGFTPIAHVGSGGTAHANAVAAGAAGFLTGTDKSKLDGIEANATADMTAAEILTAVKTVDGTGSGLDADTLDGSDSSVFATAANLTAHIDDASDAHDASAISYAGGTGMSATDVEAAVDELANEKSDVGHTHVGGTAFTLTETEVDLGSNAKRSGKFNITSSGLTTGKHVLIQQLNGPYTNKGTLADEAEMDALSVTGRVTNATTIQCYWNSDTRVRGNFKFGYAVSA